MKIGTVRATPLNEPFGISLGTRTAAENVLVAAETTDGTSTADASSDLQ